MVPLSLPEPGLCRQHVGCSCCSSLWHVSLLACSHRWHCSVQFSLEVCDSTCLRLISVFLIHQQLQKGVDPPHLALLTHQHRRQEGSTHGSSGLGGRTGQRGLRCTKARCSTRATHPCGGAPGTLVAMTGRSQSRRLSFLSLPAA